MSEPFVAEIRIFPFGKIPKGYLPCEGQILPIMQYQALASLIGTIYGGDGKTTFMLPDLRGRVPMCIGPNHRLGVAGGATTVTLNSTQIPVHTHVPCASSATPPTETSPANETWAGFEDAYGSTPDSQMNPQALSAAGASQAHSNMQPYLTLSLCIATTGIYPPRP
jgi:microcystin-dependent protein